MVPAWAASSLTYSMRALLVLEADQRIDQGFRRLEPRGDGVGDLAAQRNPALVGDIALLGVADLPDRGLEARRVEVAGDALEVRIASDHPHGLGVGLAKAELPGVVVKRRLRDDLLQHLAVEAEGARLIHGQRPAELAADLLQLLGVELAELLGRNLGAADLGQRRLPEPLEDVGDAPDAEADDQHAHHRGHNDLAEPV